MSSRDIEGENPLYLPQAKVYDRSCALGPCLLISDKTLPASTEIAIEIRRGGKAAFSGATTLKEMKRTPEELAQYLYHSSSFPYGCFLFTGTGIVPPDSFTLQQGDEIQHHDSADRDAGELCWLKAEKSSTTKDTKIHQGRSRRDLLRDSCSSWLEVCRSASACKIKDYSLLTCPYYGDRR